MKKIVCAMALLLTFAWATPSQAQFKYGVVAGLNISKMSYDQMPSLKSDNRTGFYIGPKVEFTVPIIGIGMDASLQYSQRKLNMKTSVNGVEATTSKTLRSIEIPINVRYSLGLGSLASVYVATGPQFGFNVGNKNWNDGTTLSYNGVSLGGVTSNVSKARLKDANVTWNVGVGAQLLGHLEAGVVYNIALSKWNKKYEGNQDMGFKTNTWQVQVAYLF